MCSKFNQNVCNSELSTNNFIQNIDWAIITYLFLKIIKDLLSFISPVSKTKDFNTDSFTSTTPSCFCVLINDADDTMKIYTYPTPAPLDI